MEDSALKRSGCCFSPIAGLQFGEDALHVKLCRIFCEPKQVADFFVAQPLDQQGEHFGLASSEFGAWDMFGKAARNFRRNILLPSVDSMDGASQFFAQDILEQVPACTGLESPIDIFITVEG